MKITIKQKIGVGIFLIVVVFCGINLLGKNPVNAADNGPPGSVDNLASGTFTPGTYGAYGRYTDTGFFTGSPDDSNPPYHGSGDFSPNTPLTTVATYNDLTCITSCIPTTTTTWVFPQLCPAGGRTTICPNDTMNHGYATLFVGQLQGYLSYWFNDVYPEHGACSGNYEFNEIQHFPLSFASSNCGQETRDAEGAAMIIDTMLGPTDLIPKLGFAPWFGGSAIAFTNYQNAINKGMLYAFNNLGTWSSLVYQYDNAGQVQWDSSGEYGNPTSTPNAVDSTVQAFGTDDQFFEVPANSPLVPYNQIAFTDAVGTPLFQINRGCGNILGSPKPLHTLTGPFTAKTNASASFLPPWATDNPSQVQFGGTVTVTATTPITVDVTRTYTKNGGLIPGGCYPGDATPTPITFSAGTTNLRNRICSAAGSVAGAKFCTTVSINPWSGMAPPQTPPPGSEGGIPPLTATSTVCIIVANEPYMKVYGGDVSAGNDFDYGAGCTQPQDTEIIGQVKGNSAPFFGAGTEFGAQSTWSIQRFISELGAGTGDSLAFSNNLNNNVGAGNFGGQFTEVPCIHNYFGTPNYESLTAGDTPTDCIDEPFPHLNCGPAIHDVSAFKSGSANVTGAYSYTPANPGQNAFWIQNGNQAPIDGRQITIYVRGNVLIHGNITYKPTGMTLATLPSFRLIVQGNIYIDSDVSQLDGLYVAEPPQGAAADADIGNIYDCAGGNGSNIDFRPEPTGPGAQFYDACSSAGGLVVNGAMIGRHVNLMRTNDTLSDSDTDPVSAGKCLVGPPPPCPASAAEIFNYSPELWLGSAGQTTGTPNYDSISSLPPVL